MKIFVTGGTGFVGSHFLNKAMANGHKVIVQRRPSSTPRIELIDEPYWVDKPLDHDFSGFLSGCDALVHFASHTANPPYAPLEDCIYWNVYAASKLIREAAKQNIKNVLVAGTCFEYGLEADKYDFIPPSAQLSPRLSYPVSKAMATQSFVEISREFNLKMQILRIFQVFGEGEAITRFWPSMRKAALEGSDFSMSAGTQIRDFIEVTEVAQQFLESLYRSDTKPGQPQIRNIGTGVPKTLIDFAKSNWNAWGARGQLLVGTKPLRAGEIKRLVPDINLVFEV